MEIREKASEYAEGKVNEAMTKAIEQAYIDGYIEGYEKHQEEMPVDTNENETEYIDLGLHSGTLWSADYERIDGEITYLPYDKADNLKIPTEEQWEELKSFCRWEFEIDCLCDLYKAKCVGPNGNVIHFSQTGRYQTDKLSEKGNTFFWIKKENNSSFKNSVHMYNYGKRFNYSNISVYATNSFSGFKLAIRLIR